MIIDEYISYLQCELGLSKLTVKAYKADLEQWLDFATAGGEIEFVADAVTTSDLRRHAAALSASGVSARSIKRKMAAISGLYRWMMKRNGMKSNPALDVKLARPRKVLPTAIPASQTQELLDKPYDSEDFESMRDHLILETLYSTGMRASELTSLLDSEVDSKAGRLKVHGKRNKERIIPFGPSLARSIDEYRRLRDSQFGTDGASPTFFVGLKGGALSYKALNKVVHRQLDGQVSVAKRSPHVMRHSFATDMLNQGANLNNVKQLLGHASLETTQIYTHISLSEIKQIYQLAHPRALKKGGHHGS